LHCREVRSSRTLSKATDAYYVQSEDTQEAFTPFVYEIHGNVHYMHCSDETQDHSRKFYKAPGAKEFNVAFKAAPEKQITLEDGIT